MARTSTAKGAPHVKIVISALSLVATLGGWANFTLAEHAAQSESAKATVSAAAVPGAPLGQPEPAEFSIELPAMPTITPLKVPVVATLAPVIVKPVEAPVAVAVAPTAEAPAPAPAPATLRVVSAPRTVSSGGPDRGGGGGAAAPAPATTTKSSK